MQLKHVLIIIAILLTAFGGCHKEEPADNPYDLVNYGDSLIEEDTLDPASITALHRDIFYPKCGTPGCHDGNFEPNFLTVQSTYSTMVYQSLVKTDSTDYFIYRVQPYDTAKSWLHERLTTDDQTLGRMPLYAEPLSQAEMDRINSWILNGAIDVSGNKAVYPDIQPNIPYYFAMNDFTQNAITISTITNRIDTISYNPFIVKPDSGFYVFVNVTDDSTSISQLSGSKILLSKNREDFSSAISSLSSYFISGGDEYWYSFVSTAGYLAGDTVYMRFYTNDGNHAEDLEMPTNEDSFLTILYWAFYVE